MISSISRLQDKSSEVVESYIQSNSRGIFSSNITEIPSFRTSCTTSPDRNKITPQKVSTFFIGGHSTQKIMTSNETRLTVAIAYSIITEGVYLNLALKPRFKKVLDLAINMSKGYQPPKRKLIHKDVMYVIHDHNMESELIVIKKELYVFIFVFLGDGDTISRTSMLNILVSGKTTSICIITC